MPANDVDIETVKWIGWEPNKQGKYLPRCASLAESMDPQKYEHFSINELFRNLF